MASKKHLDICQYAEHCYCKNSTHFAEFSHPHLDKIHEKGIDNVTKEYTISDEVLTSKEVILLQLRIMENLFSNLNVGESISKSSTTSRAVEGGGYALESSIETSQKVQDNKSWRRPSLKPIVWTPKAAASDIDDINDFIEVVLPKGEAAAKLERAAPYNMFLTAITASKLTHSEPLTITLQEILDESLGEIEMSMQINFVVDIVWLLNHYYFAGILDKPLIVLYGYENPEMETISQDKPQVTAIKVNMPTPFATSHTKMMLFGYTDGSMRVVISTANLYEDDWHNRTQGLWISPKLPALPEDADTAMGESPTGFRTDLLLYLVKYKLPKLQPWMDRITKTDFSAINVFLVASVPGEHREGRRGHPWGHPRLAQLLAKHSAPIDENCPVVCQSSSIDSFGPNVQVWIQNDIVNSFRKDSKPLRLRRDYVIPAFKMIYPSYKNVKDSHDDLLGGACLPHSKEFDDKQPWLKEYLHQWKSKTRHRSQAMPHIKSYTRWSDEGIYWFVLTSSNLSKTAWGAFDKNSKIEPCLRIGNYEAGVLFLPKFLTGEETFPMHKCRNGVPAFPMPYDVPLTPYGSDDKPFLTEYLGS